MLIWFDLTHSTLGNMFSRRHIEIFYLILSLKRVFIRHFIQVVSSGKIRKNITKVSSAELAQRVFKVKAVFNIPFCAKFISITKRFSLRLPCCISISAVEILNYFPPEKKIWHFMRILSLGANCIKYHNLFSRKNKKITSICLLMNLSLPIEW